MSLFWYKTKDRTYRLCQVSAIPSDQIPGSPRLFFKGIPSETQSLEKYFKGAQSLQDLEPDLLKIGLLDKVRDTPELLTIDELEQINAATFFQLGYLLERVPVETKEAYLVKTTLAP